MKFWQLPPIWLPLFRSYQRSRPRPRPSVTHCNMLTVPRQNCSCRLNIQHVHNCISYLEAASCLNRTQYLQIWCYKVPIREDELSKTLVLNRFIAGTAGSNPAEGLDVRLLCLLYVVQITRSQESCRVCVHVCLIVWDPETSTMRRPRPESG